MLTDELMTKIDSIDTSIVKSAIIYAERFQHKPNGFYRTHHIPPKTEQAILLIIEHFNNNENYVIWSKVDSLLRFNMN